MLRQNLPLWPLYQENNKQTKQNKHLVDQHQKEDLKDRAQWEGKSPVMAISLVNGPVASTKSREQVVGTLVSAFVPQYLKA